MCDEMEVKELTWEEKRTIDKIIKSLDDPEHDKLRLLQLIQVEYGSLRDEHMRYAAKEIGTSYTDLYGIATFYSLFNLNPPGRHTISVCMGTGCHVKGAPRILKKLEKVLGIKVKGTTNDQRFSLKSVRCLGCCGLAPVIMVDDQTFGRVRTGQIEGILEDFE